MEGVRKIQAGDREVLVIDYSDCKETEMIGRLISAKRLILNENRPVLILNIFNDKCYATPNFVRQTESAYEEVRHLVERNAIIGLSQVQLIILKGFVLFGDRKLNSFDSYEESIKFLIG